MHSCRVNLSPFECAEGDAVAHKARHEIVFVVFSQVLGGKKHRGIATGNDDFPPDRLAIFEQLHFDTFVLW